jgi:hypothetical protein
VTTVFLRIFLGTFRNPTGGVVSNNVTRKELNTMPINGLHLGDSETFGDLGSCVHLVPRSDGSKKENLQISTPLSVEINIDNNNVGVNSQFTDEVVITTGSGDKKKVLAVIDIHGNMKIAGKLETEATFGTTSI